MGDVDRYPKPTFWIKIQDDPVKYKKLPPETILYIIHDDRPAIIETDPGKYYLVPQIPRIVKKRWCWQYVIGNNGRPRYQKENNGDYNNIYSVSWVRPGKKYIVYINNYREIISQLRGDRSYSPSSRRREGLVHPDQWLNKIKNRPSACFSNIDIIKLRKNVYLDPPVIDQEVFFCLQLDVRNYNISRRNQRLRVVPGSWPVNGNPSANDLHNLGDNSSDRLLDEKDMTHKQFECEKIIKTPGMDTTDYRSYILKSFLTYHHDMHGQISGQHNRNNMRGIKLSPELLGRPLSLRFERTGIRRNDRPGGNNAFVPANTTPPSPDFMHEEMQNMMLFLFVRMEYNGSGMRDLYELKLDTGGSSVMIEKTTDNVFNIRAISNFVTGNSLIEGIQQFYLLLEQDHREKSKFKINSVFCDGDLLFQK